MSGDVYMGHKNTLDIGSCIPQFHFRDCYRFSKKISLSPSLDLCLPLVCNSVALMLPTFTTRILAIVWQIFIESIHKPSTIQNI